MHVVHIVVQQQGTGTSASNRSTTERPERPEQPERPERPEAGTSQRASSADEDALREQIRATIVSAQDAARDAQRQARNAQQQARDAQQHQVRIVNGVPVGADADPDLSEHTIQMEGLNNVIPPQVVDISIAFFVMCAVMVIGWPLARAFGRRLERSAPSAAVPAAMGEQLQRIEQAVEAMSIEVERISESQRFMAKLQGANNPEHVALPGSERR